MLKIQNLAPHWQERARWLAVALAYVATAYTGLWLASLPGNITPFWPPSGVALAALLIGGMRLWPGIFWGSFYIEFFNQAYTPALLLVAPVIALGNTLEAVLAAALIRELNPRPERITDDLTGVFVFGIAAFMAPLFSALLGTSILFIAGYVADDNLYTSIWQTFWKSAVAGILIFTPLLLSWSQFSGRLRWYMLDVLEMLVFAGCALGLTYLVFAHSLELQYLYLPLLIWSCFRFQPPFTLLWVALLGMLAAVVTAHGQGPFVHTTLNDSLLQLQSFMGALMFTLLLLLASNAERRRAYQDLQDSHGQLAQAVAERTVELCRANSEILSLNQQLQAEIARMNTELAVAWRLQQLVLPTEENLRQIPGLDIDGRMEPATEVGGDYYDVLTTRQGQVLLSIGDVAGHGLASGVVMLMVQTCVRTLAACGITEPKAFFQALNAVIYENLKRMGADKHLTLILLTYQDGNVRISGQHEEVLLVKGGQIQRLETVYLGFLLGLQPDVENFVESLDIELHPGDGLVIYTDGVTEARNLEEEMYSIERLCTVIERNWHKNAADIRTQVFADVQQHTCGQPVDDDRTLLVIKREQFSAR